MRKHTDLYPHSPARNTRFMNEKWWGWPTDFPLYNPYWMTKILTALVHKDVSEMIPGELSRHQTSYNRKNHKEATTVL
jgi:hypothetical protein